MMLSNRTQAIATVCLIVCFLASCTVKKKTFSYRSGNATTHAGHSRTGKENLAAYYADILGVDSKALNKDLYVFIDSWMGSPHRTGGMTRDGIDCSGFVNLVFREIYRKELPRTSRDMAQIVKRKYDHQLQEGDLVFFSFGGKDIDHVGIYLHNDRFIHVSSKQGVVISNLKDSWYYKYFSRCGTPRI